MKTQVYLEQNFIHCPKCTTKLEQNANFVVCQECGLIHYLNPAPCTVALFTKGDAVLLAKRAIDPRKGYWDAIGGFIENGETAEDSVIREAKEETNLDCKIISYLGSFPDIYGATQLPTLVFIYHLEVKDTDFSQMKAQDDVAELRWFSWDELPSEFAFANVTPALELLRASLKK